MTGFLFDTNAISEVFRKRPNHAYVAWLQALPREDQYTSTIVVGELLAGAHASTSAKRWLERTELDVVRRLTVLPFDLECSRVYGLVRSGQRAIGRPIGEPDTLIAATALRHDLTLVTANIKHFAQVPALRLKGFSPGH